MAVNNSSVSSDSFNALLFLVVLPRGILNREALSLKGQVISERTDDVSLRPLKLLYFSALAFRA
jgi:hypothetical protein